MENKKIFWLASLTATLIGLYWSVMFALQQLGALYIAFAAVNGICLIINIICLVLDLRWNKK